MKPMNPRLLFIMWIALGVTSSNGQQSMRGSDNSISSFGTMPWNTSSAYWDRILSENRSARELYLGTGNFVVSGPLITGFRREKLPSDASMGRKFLGLPVISLFVPQRMPLPPGGSGRYFAWKESSRPWSVTASARAPGNVFDGAFNEPQGSVISLGHRDR
jgi:hypothetical protein